MPPISATKPMTDGLPILQDGDISACSTQECGRVCCDFFEGNFIALYPGELEEAIAAGWPVAHLDWEPDGHGGCRAVCRAADKSCCDGGYKPLDCASYPLFPVVRPDRTLSADIKGSKCPLGHGQLAEHRKWVEQRWKDLADFEARLLDWVSTVRMVGYEPLGPAASLSSECQLD